MCAIIYNSFIFEYNLFRVFSGIYRVQVKISAVVTSASHFLSERVNQEKNVCNEEQTSSL